VRCGKQGYIPSPSQVARGGAQLTFRLERCGGLRGVVIDAATGDPLPTFTIRCGRATAQGIASPGPGHAVADPEGRFEIGDLNPDSYRLEVRAPGHGPFLSPSYEVGPGAWVEGIEIALPTQAVLVAVAVDARTGEPLAEAMLTAETGEGTDPADAPWLEPLRAGPAGPDGQLALEGLAAGRYRAELSHPELAPTIVTGIEVAAGERRDLGRVQLVPGGAVEGTVRDEEGKPVLMARLLLQGGGYQARTTTDASGAFRFTRVPPGPYDLVAEMGPTQAQQASAPLRQSLKVIDERSTRIDFRGTIAR
jgi:hypothetical protein